MRVTCYGGVREIGGNKILIEDGDSALFLDFGLPMGRAGEFFDEFVQPRTGSHLRDSLALGLTPRIDGIYRSDLVSTPDVVENAGLPPEAVDHVNAHATSTPEGDPAELQAIRTIFGNHAPKVAVTANKSMLGHTLGAAGALESLICLLAMRDEVLPPTTNLETPDEGCDLDFVPNVARKARVSTVLNNSFGFGGHNVSLIMKRHVA